MLPWAGNLCLLKETRYNSPVGWEMEDSASPGLPHRDWTLPGPWLAHGLGSQENWNDSIWGLEGPRRLAPTSYINTT